VGDGAGAGGDLDFAAGDREGRLGALDLGRLDGRDLDAGLLRLLVESVGDGQRGGAARDRSGVAADASGAMASIATSAAATIATGSILPLTPPSRVDSGMYSSIAFAAPAAALRRLTASRLVALLAPAGHLNPAAGRRLRSPNILP
jgi:hypothetical protein